MIWPCKCGYSNYVSHNDCWKCGEPRPAPPPAPKPKIMDWPDEKKD